MDLKNKKSEMMNECVKPIFYLNLEKAIVHKDDTISFIF